VRSLPGGASRRIVIATLTLVGLGALVAQRTSWRGPDVGSARPPDRLRTVGRDRSLSGGNALDLPSDRFTAAFERGVAAYNADDAETAVDAFEEAVRLEPDNAEARINLGLVYMRLQRAQDAMRELEAGARLERERRSENDTHRGERRGRADTIRE
jgi:tetratricopeptide (TPR) repeat protein